MRKSFGEGADFGVRPGEYDASRRVKRETANDLVQLLGSMFDPKGNRMLGWAMRAMMGVVFGVVYAEIWSLGIGAPTWLFGLIFGLGHWLLAGLTMGGVPMLHAGVRSGTAPAPGLYMTANGGIKAFMGGALGHMPFGLATALTYAQFAR
jgi:hypothetical protein